MNYFTKETEVVGEVSIWATPKYDPSGTEDPFMYALYAGDHKPWRGGAVKVATQVMEMTVPSGLNLVQKTIETLREAQSDVRSKADEEVAGLEKRIGELALLTYTPTPDAAVAEPDHEKWSPRG